MKKVRKGIWLMVVAVLALFLGASAFVMQVVDWSQGEPVTIGAQSAGGYLFRLEDGTGTEKFSIDDSGNTDVAGTLNSDGATTLASASITGNALVGGTFGVSGAVTLPTDTEHVGALSIAYQSITYTAGAGATGTLATIADGEVWIVYDVFIQVTETFTDTAGDDETFTIGDGNDADGFLSAASTQLAADFTEATGYQAGWYGLENGSNGAYTVDEGIFVYAPSGADETIDYALASGAGDDIGAGALTMYVVYMRIQ